MSRQPIYSKKQAKEIVAKAFDALNGKQRANLRFHAEKKTPIACGKHARHYVTSEGFG